MTNATIQRQYDEVIASHYDRDPQRVTSRSLDRGAAQIEAQQLLQPRVEPYRVLDVGLGTGQFLARLAGFGPPIQPFGLDVSEKMIEQAVQRIPELTTAVDDAANLDDHFPGQSFDLICTHFITGFVPLAVLAPKIWNRLEEGGCWSLVGGTKAGFPALQAKADSRLVRWLFGGRSVSVDDMVSNPAGRGDVVATLERHGFQVLACETFEPKVVFANFDGFMDFAYRGGWLTPFIEELGLHQASATTRWLMDRFFFPVNDHHNIEIHLARKVGG